jgi:hypothetical protein
MKTKKSFLGKEARKCSEGPKLAEQKASRNAVWEQWPQVDDSEGQ